MMYGSQVDVIWQTGSCHILSAKLINLTENKKMIKAGQLVRSLISTHPMLKGSHNAREMEERRRSP